MNSIKRLFITLSLLWLISTVANAQRQNENWCFGKDAGFSFSTNPPSFFKTDFEAHEGVACVSNRYTGSLLFYTNGTDIYDATHQVMPNGGNINPNSLNTCSQGSIIVPFIYDSTKYYVFTSSRYGSDGMLSYSVVDMTLNNGLGDVVVGQKYIPVDTGFGEPIVISEGCNTYWLVVAKRRTPEFYAYKITPIGIGSNPVISPRGYPNIFPGIGCIKISPDKRKLVISSSLGIDQFVALHDFDNMTGKVSNGSVISNARAGAYSCEFSANSKYLYTGDTICQYDVTLATTIDIINSRRRIADTHRSIAALQLAPDSNIYIARYAGLAGPNSMQQIANSNTAAAALVKNVLVIAPPNDLRLGLPLLVYHAKDSTKNYSSADTSICFEQTLVLRARAGSKYIQWQDGSLKDSFVVSKAGTYWVRAYIGCDFYADTVKVAAIIDTATSLTGKDMCKGDTIQLRPVKNYTSANYLWSNNATTEQIAVTTGGRYWVKVLETCFETTDTIDVNLIDLQVSAGRDTTICIDDTITLNGSMNLPGGYEWSTGSDTSSIRVSVEGSYILRAKYLMCEAFDEIIIAHIPAIDIDLGADTLICTATPFTLPAKVTTDNSTSFRWQDGSIDETFYVDQGGVYEVTLTNQCQTITDSIMVVERSCHFFFPSAFTPNGDGRNDIARVVGDLGALKSYRLRIFNRWGEVVYTTDNPLQGWDGNYKGQKAEVGIYYYLIKFTYNGEEEQMKGDLMLVR